MYSILQTHSINKFKQTVNLNYIRHFAEQNSTQILLSLQSDGVNL